MQPFFATKPAEETIPKQGTLNACLGMGLLQGDDLDDLLKLSFCFCTSEYDYAKDSLCQAKRVFSPLRRQNDFSAETACCQELMRSTRLL